MSQRGWDAIGAIEKRLRSADGAVYRYDRGTGPELSDLLGDAAALLALLAGAGEIERATALARRMRERLAA